MSQIEISRPQAGLQPDRLPIAADRFVELAELQMRVAERKLRPGQFGTQPQRLSKMFGRLFVQAAVLTGQAEMIDHARVVRAPREGEAKVAERLLEAALLPAERPQQEQHLAVLRFGLQDLSVEQFGLAEVARLMQPAGLDQSFFNGAHGRLNSR